MTYNNKDYYIIKGFSKVCLGVGGVLFFIFLIYKFFDIEKNNIWIAYRSFEFFMYGIFSLGIYKIIDEINHLNKEMKFFRHHYILKDTKKTKVLKEERENIY